MSYIIAPFSWVLETLCNVFQSYPIAIVLFTVIVNAALLPFNIKQQKNMAKQARLRPKLELIKEKCGDDRMKYQTAMTELYQKENVSPTGGCLPMVIRLVILMCVYWSVMDILDIDTKTRAIGDNIKISADYFNLFGLDLTNYPHFTTDIIKMITTNATWVIPILCFVMQMLSMVISNAQQKKNNPQMASQGNSMFLMMLIMPVFSLYITFQVCCAVGFYWIMSNVVNTVIMLVVNHFYSADKILAKETVIDGYNRRKKEEELINNKK